ncbi:MAG: hypothetical protein U0441_16110 [Polyangiaceae bacterium]
MSAPAKKALTKTATLTALAWGLFVPALAEACPYCANRETGGIGRKIALGLMIFLPFVVVGTILAVLRAAARREEKAIAVRSEA